MKKIIETVAENGSELGVHVYPFQCNIIPCTLARDWTKAKTRRISQEHDLKDQMVLC